MNKLEMFAKVIEILGNGKEDSLFDLLDFFYDEIVKRDEIIDDLGSIIEELEEEQEITFEEILALEEENFDMAAGFIELYERSEEQEETIEQLKEEIDEMLLQMLMCNM